MIVAKEITNNLRYAIAVIPNVSLFEYEINFQLKPVQGVEGNESPLPADTSLQGPTDN